MGGGEGAEAASLIEARDFFYGVRFFARQGRGACEEFRVRPARFFNDAEARAFFQHLPCKMLYYLMSYCLFLN